MQINLYTNSENNKVINKNPNFLHSLECILLEGCSIVQPSIIIENNDTVRLLANYVEIPSFNRFYYVNDKIILEGGKIRFNLKCDILKSNEDYLLNKKMLILRSESKRDADIPDSNFIRYAKRKIDYITISEDLISNSNNYILTTI